MGSATSKPETKVFLPSTPVEFSASFLSQLENSTESDYSRSQNTEKYIQDRVASELRKIEEQVQNKFTSTVNEAADKSEEAGISVKSVNEKIDSLTSLLKANAELSKIEISENAVRAREEVIKCFRGNEGRILNCWDEVENFKKLVKDL